MRIGNALPQSRGQPSQSQDLGNPDSPDGSVYDEDDILNYALTIILKVATLPVLRLMLTSSRGLENYLEKMFKQKFEWALLWKKSWNCIFWCTMAVKDMARRGSVPGPFPGRRPEVENGWEDHGLSNSEWSTVPTFGNT
ncbi:uncharacterized protein EI90DRAFT_3124295 [Cantharellus anzutake]|uniref:uncharacterized protein n=1 Tax=Cantharellus anzutake TaxID=1750568 RepID=UPI001903CBFB|nr:uncharacterized protein EI90DRAFT_3124295 [Cantharellus anzutake]KAF8330596.1 hypothetical protein EI90DRAFT_3124295 [Cantharellus anzutake]